MPRSRSNRIQYPVRLLRSPWLAIAVILLAVVAVYSNSLSGPFVLDDLGSIEDNPTIRSLWPISKVLHPPGAGTTVQGRPIVNLSLAINYALGGQRVVGYHVFNLAVHVLAALVLFGIVRRTLLLPGQPQRLASQSTGLALAIAILWAVHPLTTAAVTYIIQRAESLMALLYLLTLYCVIRSAAGGRRWLWQTAAVLACLLGMGCKEVMVSAPLLVSLYDRVFLSRSFKECFQKRGLLYASLAATWVLLAWLVVGAGTRSGSAGFGGKVAWWEYGLTQCHAVVNYLKLCFWPHPLVFDYGTAVITDPLAVWPQALLLAVLLVAVLAAFCWQPRIGFLGVCFFAILAPSSSVVPVMTQTVAEHRMYLPLTIVVALSVLLARRGWERVRAGREQDCGRWRWAPALAVAVTAVVLGRVTYDRNKDYRTALSIWNDTVNKRPANARAVNDRGSAYWRSGQFEEAAADFTQAVALKADYADAYFNRGVLHQGLQEYQQAVADLTQAIALLPEDFLAYNRRGSAYHCLGQFQQALADFTQAIALRPDYFVAYNNRGNTYQSLGQLQQALEDFNRAIARNPDYAEAYYNRGNTYLSLGQPQQALADISQAIALQPQYIEAYTNRGNLYQNLGRPQQAIADYSQVIALKRDSFEAYNNRGNVYQKLGQFDQAIQDYNQAIRLQPADSMAYSNRAVAFYHLKQYDQAWKDVAKAKQLGYVPPEGFLRRLSEASGRSGD